MILIVVVSTAQSFLRQPVASCTLLRTTGGSIMVQAFDRRSFLRTSAATAGTVLTCTALGRNAAGEAIPKIEAPLVDKLVIRVVVDGAHDIFIPEQKIP